MAWGRQSSNVEDRSGRSAGSGGKNNGRRWYRYDCYRSPLFLFSGVI